MFFRKEDVIPESQEKQALLTAGNEQEKLAVIVAIHIQKLELLDQYVTEELSGGDEAAKEALRWKRCSARS